MKDKQDEIKDEETQLSTEETSESEHLPDNEDKDEPDVDEDVHIDLKKEKKESSKKRKKEEQEEEDDEDEWYEDEDDEDDDDEYDEGGKGKIIIIAVVVAALIAAGGVITYQKIKSNNDEQRQEQIQQQSNNITATPEAESDDAEDADDLQTEDLEDMDDEEEVSATPEATQTPIPTSTPKPLPTETPTPTPFQDNAVTEAPQESTDSDDSTLSTVDDQQETAGVIFLGDSRFRAMANIATSGSDLWECSTSGDYSWMTGTAFSDVDTKVGNNTKVFINMGINDILNYQAYASAINEKAQEWQEKGASVYFVAVGPVSETSSILNTDISTFNTYMYNNLNIPFIDAYNYLVETGFETTDGQTYTDTTCSILYSYLNGLIGR